MSVSTMQPDAEPRIAQQTQRSNEIFQCNATTSLLLLLPAEIRTLIYVLAMSHGDIVVEFDSARYRHRTKGYDGRLLFVCRQIYAEVALLPYKLNSFIVSGERITDLFSMLHRRTPEHFRLMGEVCWMYSHDQRDEWTRSGAEWLRLLAKYRSEKQMRMRLDGINSDDEDEDQYDARYEYEYLDYDG